MTHAPIPNPPAGRCIRSSTATRSPRRPALCRGCLLINDANYPWLLLVPRRPSIVEIVDLTDAEQAQLMSEIAQASRVLRAVTSCDKINVAALGNVVPQLHVHVIARSQGRRRLAEAGLGRGAAARL
jgi:diadenosine tetraphosphate (Ap4A) HIT family hydrolase